MLNFILKILDVAKHQILSICTGVGGLDLGLKAGLESVGIDSRTVCMVEREAFAAAVLAMAVEKGRMDACPLWFGDLRDLPANQLPAVDWIVGGYPCQPFSNAGKKLGRDDPRHLWPTILGLIKELQPFGVFFENVSGHVRNGLREVLRDLAGCGYRCSFGLFTAQEVGAPHKRSRLFILGLADASRSGLQDSKEGEEPHGRPAVAGSSSCGHSWEVEPGVGRVANWTPTRVDRLIALGNAVVPQQATQAFQTLWFAQNGGIRHFPL